MQPKSKLQFKENQKNQINDEEEDEDDRIFRFNFAVFNYLNKNFYKAKNLLKAVFFENPKNNWNYIQCKCFFFLLELCFLTQDFETIAKALSLVNEEKLASLFKEENKKAEKEDKNK